MIKKIADIENIENIEDFEKKFTKERADAIIEAIILSYYDDNFDCKRNGIEFLYKKRLEEPSMFEYEIDETMYGEVIIDDYVICYSIDYKSKDTYKDSGLDNIIVSEFYLDEDLTKKHLEKINKEMISKKLKGFKNKN